MSPKRAEVVLDIARAREDLDRALSRLESLAADDRQRVSYSAHALNNYLMVVSTTLHYLHKRLALNENRDVRRSLDALKQATNLMMSTARGVLTATPDALPPLLFETASLANIAEGVCREYSAIARGKRVRVVWKGPPGTDRVLTDRVAVGAVLDNLLSNAVKYSQPGSTVLVSVIVQGEEVLCSVRDHGPGLSEPDQAKLFQRGVRLSAQPTAGEPSTGYGLAIAKDLTAALGGRLWCTSAPGDGCCFTLALPLTKMDAVIAAPQAVADSVKYD